MSPGHQSQTVGVVERLRDVLAEGVARPPGRDSPATSVVRVGPEEVTHGTLVRNLLQPVQGSDVVQGVDTRRQTAVEAEDLTVNQSCQGEIIEQIGEIFPHVGIPVLPQTLNNTGITLKTQND